MQQPTTKEQTMTELTKSEVSTSLSPTPKSFLLIRGFLERERPGEL